MPHQQVAEGLPDPPPLPPLSHFSPPLNLAIPLRSEPNSFRRLQIVNPEIKETPDAPRQADEKLRQMGSMTRDEIIMSGTMLFAVVLWIMGDSLGVPAVVAAMLGLVILLVTGVLKWADCLEYRSVSAPPPPLGC